MTVWSHFTLLLVCSISTVHSTTNEQQALLDALMDESLRSHRVQACDGERVTLHCPRNTHIVVETGFYGRVVPENQLCPSRITSAAKYDSTCDVLQAKSKLSQLCDKKRKCTIEVEAMTFEDDPCPSTSKYLQMSYKCKPVHFDAEYFCGDSEMRLNCREGKRLAIYSAFYGRTVRNQAVHCESPSKVFSKDCTRDVLPSVLTSCHAKEGCSLSVNDRSFSKVCQPNAAPYLSILFMCVNEEIFSEEAIKGELPSLEKYVKEFTKEGSSFHEMHPLPAEDWVPVESKDDVHDSKPVTAPGEPKAEAHPYHNDAGYITEDRYSFANPSGDASSLENVDDNEIVVTSTDVVGVAHDLMLAVQFLKDNREKALICVILSTSLALILILMACIVHQCCGRTPKDNRVRYSIERSQLIAKSNTILDGPPSLMEMGDIENETFLRYSLSSPPRSSHYDF